PSRPRIREGQHARGPTELNRRTRCNRPPVRPHHNRIPRPSTEVDHDPSVLRLADAQEHWLDFPFFRAVVENLHRVGDSLRGYRSGMGGQVAILQMPSETRGTDYICLQMTVLLEADVVSAVRRREILVPLTDEAQQLNRLRLPLCIERRAVSLRPGDWLG